MLDWTELSSEWHVLVAQTHIWRHRITFHNLSFFCGPLSRKLRFVNKPTLHILVCTYPYNKKIVFEPLQTSKKSQILSTATNSYLILSAHSSRKQSPFAWRFSRTSIWLVARNPFNFSIASFNVLSIAHLLHQYLNRSLDPKVPQSFESVYNPLLNFSPNRPRA